MLCHRQKITPLCKIPVSPLCFDYIKYSILLIFTFCVVFLSLAYLLILHCWDGYRRGAKGMLVPGYRREVTAHTASYTKCRQGSFMLGGQLPSLLFPLLCYCSSDVCIVLFGLLLPRRIAVTVGHRRFFTNSYLPFFN